MTVFHYSPKEVSIYPLVEGYKMKIKAHNEDTASLSIVKDGFTEATEWPKAFKLASGLTYKAIAPIDGSVDITFDGNYLLYYNDVIQIHIRNPHCQEIFFYNR